MNLRVVCQHCASTDHRSSECARRFGQIHVVLSSTDDTISLTIVDQHAEATAKLSPGRVDDLTETLRTARIVKERQHT